ncbi:hypothetical protein E1211_17795 [Micromonospora sp. 15K316]|uniref:hypothetical protein n=1 Tax=Micromonospora sp. 15K316 TaxID=2530376 RepID=UPI00104FE718|nr:hypothetical protein [Micromonospora sp. 15K316]TDC34201.1 hypothetical protein E1211_17795 [Micromonospora sp. 15K316]
MPTPAPSILDTIDNAIADWETSADAMRWTPEAPEQPTGLVIHTPTLEQLATAAQIAAAGDVFARIGAHFEQIRRALEPAWRALAPLVEADRELQRRQRVSRIRREYGRRRR